MEITGFLETMVEHDASDLYLAPACPPMYRVDGVVRAQGEQQLTAAELENLAKSIMNEQQWKQFTRVKQIDLVLSYPTLSRFRFNIYRQRSSVGIGVRRIRFGAPTLDDLQLPAITKTIIMEQQGLVLIGGAPDSGKSTTLAAIIDHRNSCRAGYILTMEDPIEFIHRHKQSVVTQREIGLDTASLRVALEYAMHQRPDVVVIGEIRDAETMEAALRLSDREHLCVATFCAASVEDLLERILNFFPEERHAQVLKLISLNFRAILMQRLVRALDGKRVPAMEILLGERRINELIKQGEFRELKKAMEETRNGCQTLDEALFTFFQNRKISLEEAMIHADDPENLELRATQGQKEPLNTQKSWNLKIKNK